MARDGFSTNFLTVPEPLPRTFLVGRTLWKQAKVNERIKANRPLVGREITEREQRRATRAAQRERLAAVI